MNHTVECHCPICVLIKANVQVCDVKVACGKKTISTAYPAGKGYEVWATNWDVDMAIKMLVVTAKDTKVPISSSYHLEKPDFSINIYRESEMMYKFCFHSLLT